MYTFDDVIAATDRVLEGNDGTAAGATARAAEYGLGPELPDRLSERFGGDAYGITFAAGLLTGLELARGESA